MMAGGRPAKPIEVPERVDALLHGVRRGRHDVIEPEPMPDAPLNAVHDAAYLDYLRRAHLEWTQFSGSDFDVLPDTHPNRHGSRPSGHPAGRAGMYIADQATGIGAGTWAAARAGIDTALTAGKLALQGANAYALCRPPGHNACSDLAWAFCYLNNAAVLAQYLLQHGPRRVAILDIDTHHGCGTQQIFYARPDVLTISIHVDPAVFPPFYMGHADETGTGEGAGFNRNLLMRPGDGDPVLLSAVETALAAITSFGAEALVLAAGFDAHRADPRSVLDVTADAYRRIGTLLGALSIPVVTVQEGGHPGPHLSDCIESLLAGLTRPG